MAKYDSRLVAASDHAINELLKAVRLGTQAKFRSGKVLKDWAMAHGIKDKDVASFVKDAKATFETEVMVRGLGETRSQLLFSPVYTLFHPKGATGRACPSALGSTREVCATTCKGCYADHCSARYNPSKKDEDGDCSLDA